MAYAPSFIVTLLHFYKRLGADTINITSVTWNPHNSLQLCCGLADGTIAIWDLDPTFRHPPILQNSLEKSSSSGPGLAHSTINGVVLEGPIVRENRDDVIVPSDSDMGPRSGIKTDYVAWEPCKNNKFNLPHPSAWLADHNTDFSLAPRSALKSVSFCPYNPHLLMTSGYESAIKVCH